MGEVIQFPYWDNKNYIGSKQYVEDMANFERIHELWDRFYDYMGQELFDRIKAGESILIEELQGWGCMNVSEFIDRWRGNSEEEFQKWLNDLNG